MSLPPSSNSPFWTPTLTNKQPAANNSTNAKPNMPLLPQPQLHLPHQSGKDIPHPVQHELPWRRRVAGPPRKSPHNHLRPSRLPRSVHDILQLRRGCVPVVQRDGGCGTKWVLAERIPRGSRQGRGEHGDGERDFMAVADVLFCRLFWSSQGWCLSLAMEKSLYNAELTRQERRISGVYYCICFTCWSGCWLCIYPRLDSAERRRLSITWPKAVYRLI